MIARHDLDPAGCYEQLRAEMIDATESGDVSRLRDLVAREVAPQDRALAHTLSRAIAQFDYVTILGLLRSPSHE